jgi:hypothetical protein
VIEKMTIGNEDKDKPNKGKYSMNLFMESSLEFLICIAKKYRMLKKKKTFA